MKTNKCSAVVVSVVSAMCLFTASHANAGFYIGAGMGQGALKTEAVEDVLDLSIQREERGWSGVVGYRFDRLLGQGFLDVEGAYIDFGRYVVTGRVRKETGSFVFEQDVKLTQRAETAAGGLNVGWSWGGGAVFLSGGGFVADGAVRPYYGIGVRKQVNDSPLSVVVRFRRFDIGEQIRHIDWLSAGIEWHF